jgi:hypothetical protein
VVIERSASLPHPTFQKVLMLAPIIQSIRWIGVLIFFTLSTETFDPLAGFAELHADKKSHMRAV